MAGGLTGFAQNGNIRQHYLKIDNAERRDAMTKEKLLTIRWNNLLTLVLGLVVLTYVVVALSNSAWSEKNGLIGLAIIGALNCYREPYSHAVRVASEKLG